MATLLYVGHISDSFSWWICWGSCCLEYFLVAKKSRAYLWLFLLVLGVYLYVLLALYYSSFILLFFHILLSWISISAVIGLRLWYMRDKLHTRAWVQTHDSNMTRVVFDLRGVILRSWLTQDVTPRVNPFESIIVRRVIRLKQWYLKMGP